MIKDYDYPMVFNCVLHRLNIDHTKEILEMAEAMGLEMMVVDPAHRLRTLNTVKVPAGVDDLKVRQHLMAKHGIEIGGGFGPLAGKIFRIGLMGVLSTEPDVLFLLSAFEEALSEIGFVPPGSAGAGVVAAREAYARLSPVGTL